jgi:hypothetical protein
MNYYFFYRTIPSFLLLFVVAFAGAQDTTSVRITIDKTSILIGEPITLNLVADIPEHEPIRFFQLDSIPHFEFLNRQKIDTANTGRGTVLSQTLQITSWDSGHWVIPAFRLRENIFTDTLAVDVGFSPFNPDQPYHDVKEIIEVNPQEEKKPISWWKIAVGAALALIVIILLFRRKKKPVVQVAAPPPDPFKEAMQRLDALQKEKPGTKEYYTKLLDIFREYIDAKKGIHSLRATSEDLLLKLKELLLTEKQYEDLSQALRLGDFVKFARYEPTEEDDEKTFRTITTMIQHIEQSPS